MMRIQVVVADDHPIFLEGLIKMLQHHPELELEVVGQVCDGLALTSILSELSPDLLLLDLNMPEKNGLEVLEELAIGEYRPKTLILSMYNDERIVKSAFKAGANGYLLKDNSIHELYVAIETVLKGERFVGKGIENSSLSKAEHRHLFQDHFIAKYQLTNRESEVLQLISEAKNNKEIGAELFISDQTVSVHRKNIMRKLEVHNTAALIKLVYDTSLF